MVVVVALLLLLLFWLCFFHLVDCVILFIKACLVGVVQVNEGGISGNDLNDFVVVVVTVVFVVVVI